MKLWAAAAVLLAVLSVARAGDIVDVEDPSNVADEFLDQLEFDEMDSQQSRGQLYADELKGLNQVQASGADDQNDLGESDDVESGMSQCKDQGCRDAVAAILDGAQQADYGESKEDDASDGPSCKDHHAAICRHKKILCEHATHGNKISAECPRTCGVCAMFSKKGQSECRDKTDACSVSGRKKYCYASTVLSLCPAMCGKCGSQESNDDDFSETWE